MKTYLAHIVFLLLCCSSAAAQHIPVWSQYMTNALPLNPAFAGSRDALSIAATYRHQWVGFEGAPVSQLLSAHMPLKNEKIALGININRDAFGVSLSQGAMVNAAYRIQSKQSTLAFGLGVGAAQAKNDWGAVVTRESGDVVFQGQTNTEFMPSASAGIYYYDSKNYISFSAPYIVNGLDGGPVKDIKFMANLGREITITREWAITPSAMLRLNTQSVYQMDINAVGKWKERFEMGFSYRTNETLVGMLRFMPNEQFAFSYSYDYTVSDLAAYQGGSHELTLTYDFKFLHNLTNPKFFR